jgi:hypothetical protein
MVLQMDKEATGKMPEGGYFTLLTDIESTQTRVIIQGPSMPYDDVFDAIFSWTKGKERICHSLPQATSSHNDENEMVFSCLLDTVSRLLFTVFLVSPSPRQRLKWKPGSAPA